MVGGILLRVIHDNNYPSGPPCGKRKLYIPQSLLRTSYGLLPVREEPDNPKVPLPLWEGDSGCRRVSQATWNAKRVQST